MLFGHGALLLPRYLRHRLYVILSNVFEMYECISPRFSNINPFRSCHGYCHIPHTHSRLWFGRWWQVGVDGWLSINCWIWISLAMSYGLVSIFPCLSLMLSRGVFHVFENYFVYSVRL